MLFAKLHWLRTASGEELALDNYSFGAAFALGLASRFGAAATGVAGLAIRALWRSSERLRVRRNSFSLILI